MTDKTRIIRIIAIVTCLASLGDLIGLPLIPEFKASYFERYGSLTVFYLFFSIFLDVLAIAGSVGLWFKQRWAAKVLILFYCVTMAIIFIQMWKDNLLLGENNFTKDEIKLMLTNVLTAGPWFVFSAWVVTYLKGKFKEL